MAAGILRRVSLAPSAQAVARGAGRLTLDQVYELHFKYVWRCLRGLGVETHALDDAAHDVFLVVSRRLADFDGERAQLTTWLYEIALRVARRHRARRAREASERTLAAAPASFGEPAPSPARALDTAPSSDQAERLSLARRALEALDAEKREVFILARVEQLSAPEIARAIGVPLNTVYSRLRAARTAFDAQIARLTRASARSPR